MVKRFHPGSEEAQDLLSIGKHFIRCYLEARNGLKQLGILRSDRLLQGDYAEWVVAQLMGLELASSTVEKAIDARDSEGHTYQIKSRVVEHLRQNTSFDIRDIADRFDFLILVFLSPSFEVLAILKVPYEVVRELGSETASTFRFRWNRSVASDPRLERVIWTDDEVA